MINSKSVIHFDFPVGAWLFDARPIWTSLKSSGISVPIYDSVVADCGGTAVSIVTRGTLMATALKKIEAALSNMYHHPEILQLPGFVISPEVKTLQYELLLCLDSLVFEFRSYLDLIATFCHRVLDGISKGPSTDFVVLSSGQKIMLFNKSHELIRHNYLLYLCDELNHPTEWYTLLNGDRNLFTHESAPYCAIEFSFVPPNEAEFEAIIMRRNITDFSTADPKDYFRVSEFQPIVDGMLKFAPAVQAYIISKIPDTSNENNAFK